MHLVLDGLSRRSIRVSKETHEKTIRANLILENFSNVHGVSCTCKESVILAMKSDTAKLRRDTSKERESSAALILTVMMTVIGIESILLIVIDVNNREACA